MRCTHGNHRSSFTTQLLFLRFTRGKHWKNAFLIPDHREISSTRFDNINFSCLQQHAPASLALVAALVATRRFLSNIE